MILFFDTETTGLVQRSLPHDHPAQPDLVQLGLALFDDDGTERASAEVTVSSAIVPSDTAKVHGITTEIAKRVGFPLQTALSLITGFSVRAEKVGGHNLDFDERVIATAFHRAGKPQLLLPTD